MSDTLLEVTTPAAPETGPEVTPLGEGRMVREDCWREVHRLFHVERRSKSEIARQLHLCRAYRAQTKGKVESAVKYFKGKFLPGRSFAHHHHPPAPTCQCHAEN